MKALNEDVDLSQLGAKERMEVLQAFRGVPRKVTLTIGMLCYRFVTPQKGTVAPLLGNETLAAKWWFGQSTRAQLSRLAYQQHTSLGQAGRSKLAVTSAFNREMEYLLKIRVVAPVCGWIGTARWQHDPVGEIYFPGGAEQIYFPSLGVSADGLFSSFVKIDFWTYLDDATTS